MKRLAPQWLRQVHRGTIVNLARIESARREFGGRLSPGLKARPGTLTVRRAVGFRFWRM